MLRNLIVIEETHEIVKGAEERSDLSEGIVGTFVREARKYGFGLALVDQTPSLLPTYITSNCHTRICLGAKSGEDARAIANMMALSQEQREFLLSMPLRAAIVHYPLYPLPLLMVTSEIAADDVVTEKEIEDSKKKVLQSLSWQPAAPARAEEKQERAEPAKANDVLPWEEIEYLIKIAKEPFMAATARDGANSIHLAKGNSLRQRLRTKGMIEEARIAKVLVVAPSSLGWEYLHSAGAPVTRSGGKGGLVHCYYQHLVCKALQKRYPGCRVRVEDGSSGKSVDVSLEVNEGDGRNGRRAAYEIVVNGEDKEISNVLKDVESGYDEVVLCADRQETLDRLKAKVVVAAGEEVAAKVRYELLSRFLE